MMKTVIVYVCDGCGKEGDIFVSREKKTPGRWEMFLYGARNTPDTLHACGKECAVKIDAAQIDKGVQAK